MRCFFSILLICVVTTAIFGCKSTVFTRSPTPKHRWFAAFASPETAPKQELTLDPDTVTIESPDESLAAISDEGKTFGEAFDTAKKVNREITERYSNRLERKTQLSSRYLDGGESDDGADADSLFSETRTTGQDLYKSASDLEESFRNTVFKKNGECYKLNFSGMIALGLANSPEFYSSRIQPSITETAEAQALAKFDPKLTGTLKAHQSDTRDWGEDYSVPDYKIQTELGLSKFYATGTTLALGGYFSHSPGSDRRYYVNDDINNVSLQLTQSLLQGRGIGVNLADVRKARIDTMVSQYEFRDQAIQFIAQIEVAGWDYIGAVRTLQTYRDSYRLSKQNLDETIERINKGVQSSVEQHALVSELMSMESQMTASIREVEIQRLTLLMKILPHNREYWKADIDLEFDLLPVCDYLMSSDQHIEIAKLQRPDLNEARLRIQKGRLDLVKTRDGLLPKLDFFTNLSYTGTSTRENPPNAWSTGDNTWFGEVGVTLERPLGNRAAKAANRASVFSQAQQRLALDNLTHQAESNVYMCYCNVLTTWKQIQYQTLQTKAAWATYVAEKQRMQNGLSTTFMVTQAQEKWSKSRQDEIRYVIDFRKALIELYVADGSLLDRRGVHLQMHGTCL